MGHRLAPLRTNNPVPTGLMIVAGVLCPFVPVVLMIPYSLLVENPSDAPQQLVELFVYVGWMFALAILPFALVPAYFANRDGINGWLPALLGGAVFGGLAAIVVGGSDPEFLGLSVALGTTYAAAFWALAHGMTRIKEKIGQR